MPLKLSFALVTLWTVASACSSSPKQIPVTVASGDVVLAGTLYLPHGSGPHPSVVIVHGSGAQTREPFVPLATTFAERGIAALIYDKRGTGESTGNWQQSPFGALADDAAAVLAFMAQHPQIDSARAGIWGGSEGGWIAPWVAARSKRVALVMVQSAPVVGAAHQHLYQIEQLVRQAGGTPHDVETAMAYTRMQHRYAATGEGWTEYAAQRDANRSGLLAMLGGPATPDDWWWTWWRSKMAFDPVTTWEQVRAPVFAIWGENDRTVPVLESRELLTGALQRAGNKVAVFVIIANGDHDLAPTGAARLWMVIGNALSGSAGRTPSMLQMTDWAAHRFGLPDD